MQHDLYKGGKIQFEHRIAKQNSYCRSCDKLNKKGEEKVIYIYSIRNSGQSILLCENCIKEMYETIIKEN